MHTIFETVPTNVDVGYRQRSIGNIDGIHVRVRKCKCRRDRDTAAAGAQIDHAPNLETQGAK